MKIGLVLSGGGSRGFAHLGILKAMDELNIQPSVVSGASAGALIGALYCSGIKPQTIAEIIEEKGIKKHLSFAMSKMGLFSFKKVEKILLEYLPKNSFEDLKIPLFVAATNIKRGEVKYFSEGQLIPPVLASCAIPGLFTPIKINGKAYIDGGVIDNLPLSPIQSLCDFTIGVNLMPPEKNMPISSAKDILLKCLMISIGNQSLSKNNAFDIFIQPENISHFNGLKITKSKEMFQLGYDTAMLQLKDLKI